MTVQAGRAPVDDRLGDRVFARWARFVLRWRWPTLVLAVLFTAALAVQIPDLTNDNSPQGFLHDDDPVLSAYDDFRDRFGRDEQLIVSIEPPDLFDLGFLERLRAFHADLEESVPHLDEVTSLVNARSTYGRGDELVVEGLLDGWPLDADSLEHFEARVRESRLYLNLLVSSDVRATAVLIRPDVYSSADGDLDELGGFEAEPAAAADPPFLSEAENYAVVAAVREVMDRHTASDWSMHLAGGPAISERITRMMQADTALFVSLSVVVIAALLFLLFRRVSAVILSLIVVLAATLSTLGIMALTGLPMSFITGIIPPFLLTVGICDAVHVLTIAYQRLDAGYERDDAIAFALGHCGLAVAMTSLTTAAGLASFATAELVPVANLGIIAPIGILLAFVYSVTLLPALLAVTPLADRPRPTNSRIARLLGGCGDLATHHPWRVVALASVVLLVSAMGAAKLEFSHEPIKWFPPGDPLRVATEAIDEQYRGTTIVEVLVETGRENALHDPELLRRLEALETRAESIRDGDLFIGKSISIVGIAKEIHQALNDNDADAYAIPAERALVAQELVLFENSGADDLDDVTDSHFSTARLTLRAPEGDAMAYPPFLERLSREFQDIVGDAGEVKLTGLMMILSQTFKALITSMARSYAFAIAVITLLMMILLGSLRRGLLSMVPNLFPIVVILGVMGWFDVALDGASLLVGSIVLGLAVDDTIHFMHKFRGAMEKTGDVHEAVRETLETTGSALLLTTVALSLGFFIFSFGSMRPIANFGLLAGLAALTAFLADVLLAPALMALVERRRP